MFFKLTFRQKQDLNYKKRKEKIKKIYKVEIAH